MAFEEKQHGVSRGVHLVISKPFLWRHLLVKSPQIQIYCSS